MLHEILTDGSEPMLDKREGSVDISERAQVDTTRSSSCSPKLRLRLTLLERLETLEIEDGVRDKDEDAVDVTERRVGPLEGEETDWVTGAGSGGGGADDDRIDVDAIEVGEQLPS